MRSQWKFKADALCGIGMPSQLLRNHLMSNYNRRVHIYACTTQADCEWVRWLLLLLTCPTLKQRILRSSLWCCRRRLLHIDRLAYSAMRFSPSEATAPTNRAAGACFLWTRCMCARGWCNPAPRAANWCCNLHSVAPRGSRGVQFI